MTINDNYSDFAGNNHVDIDHQILALNPKSVKVSAEDTMR